MNAEFHRRFINQYWKLSVNQRKKCDARLLFFERNPYDPLLNNHPLKGKYKGYRSINITGDLRAIYCILDNETAYFIFIDTHSNLYA